LIIAPDTELSFHLFGLVGTTHLRAQRRRTKIK
jgi:hypothetical protein